MNAINSRDHRRGWIMIVAMAAILVVSIWVGNSSGPADSGKTNVVCTFLPVYVFALNVIGDDPDFDVQQLVPQNVGCPHSYSLRTGDVQKIDNADVILANGLGSERFLDKLLDRAAASRSGVFVLEISDGCDLLPAAADRTHEHDDACDHGQEDAHGNHNTHVWVSPIQAQKQVQALAAGLGKRFPEKAVQFQTNADGYIAKLAVLSDEYRQAAEKFQQRNIATFHAAFDYLARDLNLNIVTTLTSIPGHEPASGELRRTIETIRKHDVHVLFIEPAYDSSNRLAETVRNNAGGEIRIYTLNPFNTLEGKPAPDSYERVMRDNLETLKQALGSMEPSS